VKHSLRTLNTALHRFCHFVSEPKWSVLTAMTLPLRLLQNAQHTDYIQTRGMRVIYSISKNRIINNTLPSIILVYKHTFNESHHVPRAVSSILNVNGTIAAYIRLSIKCIRGWCRRFVSDAPSTNWLRITDSDK